MTTRRSLALITATATFAALLAVGLPRSSAQDPEAAIKSKRSEFMRLKLDYAKGVLEGLALERMDDIAKNAKSLKEMSAAAQWEVPTVPSAEYLTHTAEFQRIAAELARQAEARNLEGATLAYVRLTVNCVDCHKAARGATR